MARKSARLNKQAAKLTIVGRRYIKHTPRGAVTQPKAKANNSRTSVELTVENS